MSTIFVDCADRYPTGNAVDAGMIGVWANVPSGVGAGQFQIVEPAFGARTGNKCWLVNDDLNTDGYQPRVVFQGGAVSEIFFACAFYVPEMPQFNNKLTVEFRDASNLRVGHFDISSTGLIQFYDGSSATVPVGATSTPVVAAGAWYWFEFHLTVGAGSGAFQCKNADGSTILNLGTLSLANNVAGLAFVNNSETTDGSVMYVDDMSAKDASGTSDNTWYPDAVKNFLLLPDGDDPSSGWDFTARRMYENGVGQIVDAADNSGWEVSDAGSLEVGTGDFTIEGTYRWDTLPGTGENQHLIAKWRTSGDHRSWRLYLYESGGSYYLAFEISTDGTTGTATFIHDYPWEPVPWHQYKIAVSRDTGVNRLFIDGVQRGTDVADTNSYANRSASVVVGARQTSATLDTEPFDGWVDEVRFTVGVGRYTAEYTPSTTAFPRDGTDPDWASVQLLMGFDNGQSIDESSAGRTVTTRGDVSALITDDGLFAYQSIDKLLRDDTFVEAAYLPATGTLEFGANPSATEQVVVGATTYTFVSSLTGANDVLIGADAEESLENLVAAINAGAGEGVVYGTGTTANASAYATDIPGAIIEVSARVPGTVGNTIVFTTTVTGATISGSGTLENGTDIPSAGIYSMEPLPPSLTRIDSVTLFTRRSSYGTGTGMMQPGIIDAALSTSNGADATAPANPAWQVDYFDDNGGVTWTTASLNGAKFRVNRTA